MVELRLYDPENKLGRRQTAEEGDTANRSYAFEQASAESSSDSVSVIATEVRDGLSVADLIGELGVASNTDGTIVTEASGAIGVSPTAQSDVLISAGGESYGHSGLRIAGETNTDTTDLQTRQYM